jgi:hypothetical protein
LRVVNGPDHWLSASELTLQHPKTKIEPGQWTLVSNNGRVAITLGVERLQDVREGVTDIANGTGDWAAPNDDDTIDDAQMLFFWPLKWARGARPGGP